MRRAEIATDGTARTGTCAAAGPGA